MLDQEFYRGVEALGLVAELTIHDVRESLLNMSRDEPHLRIHEVLEDVGNRVTGVEPATWVRKR